MKVLIQQSDSFELTVVEAPNCTRAVFQITELNLHHGFENVKVEALPPVITLTKTMRVGVLTTGEHLWMGEYFRKPIAVPFSDLGELDPNFMFNPYADLSEDQSEITLTLVTHDGHITDFGRQAMNSIHP